MGPKIFKLHRIFIELLYNTCLPGSKHRLLRSKTCGSRYALERVRLISVASSFPPRPSNSGVAFAEQSTKNSILPSFGLPGSGTSSSAEPIELQQLVQVFNNF